MRERFVKIFGGQYTSGEWTYYERGSLWLWMSGITHQVKTKMLSLKYRLIILWLKILSAFKEF